VLVQHSVSINRPIETVTAALAAGPRKWLPRFNGPIHAQLHRRVAGIRYRKNVVVMVDQSLPAGENTLVPITWEATFIKRLFPVMTGTVELAPAGNARVTRLTVCGVCEPPLRSLCKQLDDSLVRQVAMATVKELAESIGKRFEARTVDAGDAGPSLSAR
jgi:hypothetical protein